MHSFIMVFHLKGIQQVLYRNGTPTMYSLIQTLILRAVLSLEEIMLFGGSILFFTEIRLATAMDKSTISHTDQLLHNRQIPRLNNGPI